MNTRTIKMKLNKEDDLYHPLDPDGILLSEEVKDYLFDRLSEKAFREQIELRIRFEGPFDQNKAETAIRKWPETELANMRRESKLNILKQIRLIAVGLVFIMASLVLKDKIPIVWDTVLATIGSFSIWEASNIWLIQNPRIRNRRIGLRWLQEHMDIVFEETGKAEDRT